MSRFVRSALGRCDNHDLQGLSERCAEESKRMPACQGVSGRAILSCLPKPDALVREEKVSQPEQVRQTGSDSGCTTASVSRTPDHGLAAGRLHVQRGRRCQTPQDASGPLAVRRHQGPGTHPQEVRRSVSGRSVPAERSQSRSLRQPVAGHLASWRRCASTEGAHRVRGDVAVLLVPPVAGSRKKRSPHHFRSGGRDLPKSVPKYAGPCFPMVAVEHRILSILSDTLCSTLTLHRLSGVRSNHLSYRPSPPPHPPPLHDATTPRRKRGNTPFRTT